MEFLIDFLKKALEALLALFGIQADKDFVENVEDAVDNVIDFGKDAAATK